MIHKSINFEKEDLEFCLQEAKKQNRTLSNYIRNLIKKEKAQAE